MKAIQDAAGFAFILAVALFSSIAIFGVWELFDTDVISKSLMTIGLLALVAIIVIVAGRFVGTGQTVPGAVPALPNPAFHSLRRVMLGVLIVAVTLLALLGVLAIWDVIAEKEVLYKSLSSIAILAFAAFVIVMTCLEREGGSIGGRKFSIGGLIGVVFLAYLFSMFLFNIMGRL